MHLKDILPFGHTTPSSTDLQHQVSSIFNRFLNDCNNYMLSYPARFPAINLSETEKEIVINAELPGMGKDDIKIEVNKGMLTLKGEKKSKTENQEANYYLREICKGSFVRTVALPFLLDPNQIEASFDQGVLTIRIHKSIEQVGVSKQIPIH